MYFKLGLALETQHQRIPALSVLGDGRVELGETLQARQLVQDKPYRLLVRLGRIQEPQHQQVDPEAMKRAERVALGRAAK